MSDIIFQRPVGTAWAFKWKDHQSNLIQSAAAPGYETRISLGPDPVRTLELNYTILYGAGSTQANTRDRLLGFFNLRQGDFDSFLVDLGSLTGRTEDSSVAGQVLTPDANNIASLIIGHEVSDDELWNESIYEVRGVNGISGTAPIIRKDGTPLTITSDYLFHGPGYAVAGVTYPGLAIAFLADTSGSVITADFTWYYRMRFAQPQIEVERFLFLMWKAQQIELVTTRTK